MKITIRQADRSEHAAVSKIAKESLYTKDFTNLIFSGEDCYRDGRVRVAEGKSGIVGFSCFRCRKRDGWTVLYFVGVTAPLRGLGVGATLVQDLFVLSEIGIELKVMKANPAVRLYERLGFSTVGEAYEGKAWVMRKGRGNTPSPYPSQRW